VACDSPAWQLLRLAPVRGKMAYPAKVCGLRRSRGWHSSRFANESAAPARRTAEPTPGSYRLTVARSARRVPAIRWPPACKSCSGDHCTPPVARHCGAMKVAMELTKPRSFNAPSGRERPRSRP
jgi:hypothetical protein